MCRTTYNFTVMELSKCLQDDILKIQNELRTAIQNHQVLVLRQQVSPSESIKTQIEEVQRHIICLGESQKILVTRLQNDLRTQTPCVNNKHKGLNHQVPSSKCENESNKLRKNQHLGRSLLNKDINKDELRVKVSQGSDNDNINEQSSTVLKGRHASADSSSEENRTPCQSPGSLGNDVSNRGIKRTLSETLRSSVKRPKTTLQAAPRPSSPVPARSSAIDSLSCSSDESLDSLISQQQGPENIVEFALSLGLVTKDVYSKVVNKKRERRKRRVSNQHHLYNNLWDLTVVQKRSRVKEPDPEVVVDEVSRDCATPESDSDSLCFICQKPGELRECTVCLTGCHVNCTRNNVCPACTHEPLPNDSSPLVQEKKKELERLRLHNMELLRSVSKLREKAKELSASLLNQTAKMNQLTTEKEKIDESIKKVKDFVVYFQSPVKSSSTMCCESSGPISAS